MEGDDLWTPLLFSLLAGAATGIGALTVLCLRGPPSDRLMAFVLALAAGVMVTVSADLWVTEGLRGGDWAAMSIGAAGGAVVYFLIHRYVQDPSEEDAIELDKEESEDLELAAPREQKLRTEKARLAMFLMLALTAHNFPEGLAVAVSTVESVRSGTLVMVAIALHNIPEGICVAVPVYAATQDARRAVGMAVLSGLSEPLGAALALTVLRPFLTPRVIAGLLSFAAGIMTLLAGCELWPKAGRYRQPRAQYFGFLLGAAVLALTSCVV